MSKRLYAFTIAVLLVTVLTFTTVGSAGWIFADETTETSSPEDLQTEDSSGGDDGETGETEGDDQGDPQDPAEDPGQGAEETSEEPGESGEQDTEDPGNQGNPEGTGDETDPGEQTDPENQEEMQGEDLSYPEYYGDEEYYYGEDWLTEEEAANLDAENEERLVFAGESGTTNFEALPLLDLSTSELIVCSFCTGKDLGKIQKAVILSYLTAGTGTVPESEGILSALGLSSASYAKWCEKNELETLDLRNTLSYFYEYYFRNAQSNNTKDRMIRVFRDAKNTGIAISAFYCVARERNIRLPYTKDEIMNVIMPKAQKYADLFALGGEERVGTAGVTYYNQGNYGNVPYSDGTIADSGCGLTSFSMIASELTGLALGPEVLAAWATENGVDTVYNWGSYWWLAARFGIRFLGQYTGGYDTAIDALREGHLVIASLRGDGFFTTSDLGHYILLTGIDSDNKISVNDPSSYDRSVYGPYDIEKVFGGCIQYWIFDR